MALRAATSPGEPVAVAPEPAAPRPTRIVLTAKQAAELDADALVVLARGSWPDAAGHYVLHAVPASIPRVDAAVKVALGELDTRKPRKR